MKARTRRSSAVPVGETREIWLLARLGLVDAWRALVLFWRSNCPGMGGMIAFFGFLSIVPLVLLLLAIVGPVMGRLITPHEFRDFFHGLVPGLSEKQFLDTYWTPIRHSHVATTVLGVITLLFGTFGLHDSVDWSVNRLWQSPHVRGFWIGKLRGLAVILWFLVFGSVSFGLTALAGVILSAANAPGDAAAFFGALIPLVLVDSAVFTALYRLTPTVRVALNPAFRGGLVGGGLWAASKFIFGWWVLTASNYDRVYGPLAAGVIVMLWLWVSAMIFLYGSSVVVVLQAKQAKPPAAPAP